MKKLLRRASIPFKMYPKMVGSPDFLVGEKVVVFCDSGFWHGRNWRKLRTQLARGSNASYWVAHIARNRNRDREVNSSLRKSGYRVLRFWDSEILNKPEECSRRIRTAIGLMSGDE
jgi:DNA mismatch endonuclease (patch repair protein)